MALRAKQPDEIKKRLKLFMFGPAGVGKTTAATQFPHAYIIDCEHGTDYYAPAIKQAGSVVFHSNDVDEIAAELRSLLTEKHEYRTLVIDPVTIIYQSLQEKWDARFMAQARDGGKKTEAELDTADWGVRYWGKVKGEHKRINNLIMRLDMNVIMTSHEKVDFASKLTTFDAMKGLDYLFDVVFQLVQTGEKRFAKTIKERAMPGQARFKQMFEWGYDAVANAWGKDIMEAPAATITLATAAQVAELERLLAVVKLPDSVTPDKWLEKSQATTWGEMETSQIAKCIVYCQKLIGQTPAKEALNAV